MSARSFCEVGQLRGFTTLTTTVAVLLLGLGACERSGPTGTWTKLPPAPLSARYDTHVVAVGDEILVIGGTNAPPCPPNADCVASKVTPFADGAAFNPQTRMWRSIATAPVPVGAASTTVSGHTLYISVAGTEAGPGVRAAVLAYDAGADRWTEMPALARPEELKLVAAGDRLLAYHETQEHGYGPDLSYDAAAKSWRDVPRDPLAPSFDRSLVWTGKEMLLIAPEAVPQPSSVKPAVYRAAALNVETGTWKRLGDSEIVGWDPSWYFSGDRVVNASVGSADGGQVNNWGKAYPFGGFFDPATRSWRSLPAAPSPGTYRGPSAGGDEHVVTTGRVLAVRAGSWTILDTPEQISAGAGVAWKGNSLFLWGGYVWQETKARLLPAGWVWTPDTRA